MKIRIVSDLHYEVDHNKFHTTRIINDESEPVLKEVPIDEYYIGMFYWTPPAQEDDSETVLIIAGDMWYGIKSLKVIKTFAHRFKAVIVVLGNHDYWFHNIYELADEYVDELNKLKLSNVYLLNRDTVEIDGFLFVGATLWTDMKDGDPLVYSIARRYMGPDFTYIKTGNVSLTGDDSISPNEWLRLNQREMGYLQKVVEYNTDKRIVVVTHHLPSEKSCDPKFGNTVANYFFCSEYGNFIADNEHIVLWVHGHTHANCDYYINKTRIVCNPRGYGGENKDFDPNFSVEI